MPDACKCSGGWALSTGWNFNLNCSLDKPLCVPDVTDVCGTASFKGKYYRRGKSSETLLGFDIEDLFGLNIFNPKPITIDLEHKAPLSIRNPINLNNCTARYDIKPCASCEICNNGTGFEVDCSNIEVIKVLGSPVYLPKTEGCIGIPKG